MFQKIAILLLTVSCAGGLSRKEENKEVDICSAEFFTSHGIGKSPQLISDGKPGRYHLAQVDAYYSSKIWTKGGTHGPLSGHLGGRAFVSVFSNSETFTADQHWGCGEWPVDLAEANSQAKIAIDLPLSFSREDGIGTDVVTLNWEKGFTSGRETKKSSVKKAPFSLFVLERADNEDDTLDVDFHTLGADRVIVIIQKRTSFYGVFKENDPPNSVLSSFDRLYYRAIYQLR